MPQESEQDSTSEQDQAVGFFCRHLVGLCIAYRHKTGHEAAQPARFTVCSGTLIVIHGITLFLSAGHVLKELDKLRNSDKVEIVAASFADTFGLQAVSKIPIPFDLINASFFYIDDDAQGLDFGVIFLNPYYVRLLARNGIVPITEKHWQSQSGTEFEGFALLGFPGEKTQDHLSDSNNIFISAMMCGLIKLNESPIDRMPTRSNQVIGQLRNNAHLKSIKGMSGGPIFGFKRELNGSYRYWIVGIQSSWYPESRVVYATSLPVLASLMTKWANEAVPAEKL